MLLERMNEFFAARVQEYDDHMLCRVQGCRQAYDQMARLLPPDTHTLLDLGCGTGLELEPIFQLFPDMQVTGIDLTQEMLDQLRTKYQDKQLELICGNYLDADFGSERFDHAVSFQTMHHLGDEEKYKVYAKIWQSLKAGGSYIESDYMLLDQVEEQAMLAQSSQLVANQQDLHQGVFHRDIPMSIDHQVQLLAHAGFADVQQVFRQGNTTILVARKLVI